MVLVITRPDGTEETGICDWAEVVYNDSDGWCVEWVMKPPAGSVCAGAFPLSDVNQVHFGVPRL